MKELRDNLPAKGRVEIFVAQGAPEIVPGEAVQPATAIRAKFGLPPLYKSAALDFSKVKLLSVDGNKNIILNQGRGLVLQALTTGFILAVARIAIGDRGTIPSDQTIPKVPTKELTGLYNEIFRSDIETTTLDIESASPTVQFIKTFSALVIPITSFSNQANPIVNEVGLVVADLFSGAPLPRADVAFPNTAPADEKVFALRTFKSVPFQAANQITITIRYTIFIE